MASRERPMDRGRRIARSDCAAIGREIRVARRGASRSIRTVAGHAGMSTSQLSRLERGELRSVPVDQLARAGAAVGLDIRIKAYPGPDPVVDAGQIAVIGRLRARLPAAVSLRLEVVLPGPNEQRAWDVVLDGLRSPESAASLSLPVDVDTRFVDAQGQIRRLHAKRQAAGAPAVLWVVADTVHNRATLTSIASLLIADFPISARQALARLKAGQHPGGSSIVLI